VIPCCGCGAGGLFPGHWGNLARLFLGENTEVQMRFISIFLACISFLFFSCSGQSDDDSPDQGDDDSTGNENQDDDDSTLQYPLCVNSIDCPGSEVCQNGICALGGNGAANNDDATNGGIAACTFPPPTCEEFVFFNIECNGVDPYYQDTFLTACKEGREGSIPEDQLDCCLAGKTAMIAANCDLADSFCWDYCFDLMGW
jgi:hypothetical protein